MQSRPTQPAVSRDEWFQAVEDVIKSALAARAVHRPVLLLYLLGRAQRNEPREVKFADIDAQLAGALGKFGSAKRPEPMLPFWHLRSSPFWEVRDADSFPRRRGKDRPTRGALIKGNAVGAVLEPWWAALTTSSGLAGELARHILVQVWNTEQDRKMAADAVRVDPASGRAER